jgi:hypothetical protein
MTKQLTFAFFIVALFFISCRKDKRPQFDGINCTGNCFILTGTLKDSAANIGINNGEVRFWFNDISGTFSTKKTYLGKTVTDANGNYSFTFNGTEFSKKMGYYHAEAYKDNMFADLIYTNRVETFDLDSTRYNIPFVQNFLLFSPATLKVRVVATSVTNFEFLTIGYHYGKAGTGIIFRGGRGPIDTTITWRTAGGLKTYIQSDAKGNTVNIEKKDTVLIPVNATRQVEIRL